MPRKVGRDTWLYSDVKKSTGERRATRVEKFAGETGGRLELNSPASDMTFRMLTGAYKAEGPRITDWGGKNEFAVKVQKSAHDYPATRQLKDPFEGLYSQGIALEPPLPPDRLLNLTEENTLHSGCLMAKAYDACGRGWGFEPREGKKADKALIKSELPEKLKMGMEVLTPNMTFGEMLYQAAWEMDAIGWGVWETVRLMDQWSPGQYAPIGAIYPIPSFTIRATIDPRRWVQIRAGRVRFFKTFGAKCEVNAETGQVYDWKNQNDMKALAAIQDPEVLASEFIIFKSYTPRSLWYGIPRWISAVPTIAELTAIREFNVSWFASGGQTDYLVHFKAQDIETAKTMRDEVRQQMQENAGRGHTNLLTAGTEDTEVTAQKLGELLREGHFRFRRGDLAKEVLIAHNVPPYRIGWAEQGSLGGSTADEMLGAYKFGAIQPIQTIIEDRLYCTLFDKDMGIDTGVFRLKLAELQLDDMSKELDSIIMKVDAAIMSPNEAREELGMDPVEDDQEQMPQDKENGNGESEQEVDPYAEPKTDENGQPITMAEGDFPATPDPTAPEQEQDSNAPANGAPKGLKPGMQPKKPSQAEAMNKYYYKGKELGASDNANAPVIGPDGQPIPKHIGPDGKPAMPFDPGAKPNPEHPGNMGPDGSPVPGPEEKAVDKSLAVITSFEKTLRDALRGDGPADAREPVSESPPSERPSRRVRRQPKI